MGTPATVKPQAKLGRVGPYRLLKPIAEGGMGIVYRAERDGSDEQVALKVVRVHNETMLASFRREIYALRSIDHPWVVRIVAEGVHDGQPWYAMPLLRGRTLGALIDARHGRTPPPTQHGLIQSQRTTIHSNPSEAPEPTRPSIALAETVPPPSRAQRLVPAEPLALGEVLTLMRALCEPLAYVHGRGVVHRDLKPDNIIIRDDGAPMLVDFGLVQLFSGERTRDVLEVAGNVLGTPAYMAPEQIRGDLVDARADLYALGCMLYEIVTGSVPFDGTAAEVLQMHLSHTPVAPSELVSGLDPAFDTLVMRLLEKDPRRRFGFAADVGAALEALGAAKPRLARAPEARTYLYRPALAGRGKLVARLQRAFGRQHGSCVLLGGRSGVGKTRLAMELATIAARKGMTVVTGQCVDVRDDQGGLSVRAAPLHPLRPLLMAVADRCRSSSRAAARRILGDDGPVLAQYEPSLATLPGHGDRPPPPLPPDAARLRLLDALSRVTARFAATRPLFVVLDDIQWADELSLAFLGHIDQSYLADAQMCIIATYRSEERSEALSSLLEAEHVDNVDVGPLDRDAVRAMVGDMLALREPPPALVDFLMQESAGNPFFIAEYLRTAIGESVLVRETGVWRVGAGGDSPESLRHALPMPGGLRDLVERRVRQLSDEARDLAELAAVLGKEVDGDVLLAASRSLGRPSAEIPSSRSLSPAPPAVRERAPSLTEDTLDGLHDGGARSALEELRRIDVLEEAERGHLRFSHDKVREYLYAGLSAPRRAALHLACAEHIERRHGDAPDFALQYPLLAHHFLHGGSVRRTIDYLELAGEQALSSAAPGEACRFFERVIALEKQKRIATDERRARWLRRLGEARYQTGDLDGAGAPLRRCLDLLALQPKLVAGIDDRRIRSLLSSVGVVGAQLKGMLGFDAPRSQSPAERARLREAALAAERLSQVHYFHNEQTEAFSSALECVQYAEGIGPSPELARAYAVVGIAVGFVPLPPLVERYTKRAIEIAEEVDDPHAIGFTRFLRGLSELNAGRHLSARGHLESGIEVAARIGDTRAQQEMIAVVSHVYNVGGDHERALANMDRLAAAGRRTKNMQSLMWARSGMAMTFIYLGRAEEALPLFDEAVSLTDVVGDRAQRIVNGAVAEAHMMLGHWEQALALADATLQLSEGVRPTAYHSYMGQTAACEVLLGAWERAEAGDAARALGELRDKSRRACSVLDAHARVFQLAAPQARIYRGLAHWLDGQPRRARRAWRESLDLSIELSMPAQQARAHYELGRHLPVGDRERASHLTRARALWEGCSTRYWLDRLYTQPH